MGCHESQGHLAHLYLYPHIGTCQFQYYIHAHPEKHVRTPTQAPQKRTSTKQAGIRKHTTRKCISTLPHPPQLFHHRCIHTLVHANSQVSTYNKEIIHQNAELLKQWHGLRLGAAVFVQISSRITKTCGISFQTLLGSDKPRKKEQRVVMHRKRTCANLIRVNK